MTRKKNIIALSFLAFLCLNATCQESIIKPEKNELTTGNELEISTEKKEVNKELEKNAEPILTPEEQGFTLIYLPDGKRIYRKESNGILIEFYPEDN